jgi:hypothetical protein
VLALVADVGLGELLQVSEVRGEAVFEERGRLVSPGFALLQRLPAVKASQNLRTNADSIPISWRACYRLDWS